LEQVCRKNQIPKFEIIFFFFCSHHVGQQGESEGNDRIDMNLPNQQQQLFEDVLNNTPDGIKPK